METHPSPQRSWRRLLTLGLRLALSATLLAWILGKVDLDAILALVRHARPGALLVAQGLLLVSAVLAAGVWKATFPRQDESSTATTLSALDAARYTLIAFSINNVIPTGVAGDVYRAWAGARRGFSVTTAVFTVFMDRWCAFLVLLASLGLTLSGLRCGRLPGASPLPEALLSVTSILALAFVCASVAVVAASSLPTRLLARLQRLHVSVPHIRALALDFWSSPGRMLVALSFGFAAIGLEALSIWWVALSLGCSGDPLVFMAMAPLLRVLHRLPGFVNSLGAQEVAAVAVWGCMGIPAETSLSISLLLHALHLGVGLVGLPLYLSSAHPAEGDSEVPEAA